MSINVPTGQLEGDLSRAKVSEPEMEWPDKIEIVAHFGKRRKRVEIPGGEFFGLTTGAPLSGDQVIGMIERLRKGR